MHLGKNENIQDMCETQNDMLAGTWAYTIQTKACLEQMKWEIVRNITEYSLLVIKRNEQIGETYEARRSTMNKATKTAME